MAHGTADPVVNFKFGQGSYVYLRDQLGFPVAESSKVYLSSMYLDIILTFAVRCPGCRTWHPF